jgi:hypothetical protein
MTTEQKIIKNKLGLLELAKQLLQFPIVHLADAVL